jgi:hypothetical protein
MHLLDASNSLLIFAGLFILCLLFGGLIIWQFFSIWQSVLEKRRFYNELINRYENESDSDERGEDIVSAETKSRPD